METTTADRIEKEIVLKEAFRMNRQGWAQQLRNIEAYVAENP